MSDEIVYVCNRCGETFSLEEGHRVNFDGENWTVCPNCRSDDIEEGARCKVCRDIHYTFDLRHGVCKGCLADAVESYKSCLNYLMPWEREVLEDEYGTIDITERDE